MSKYSDKGWHFQSVRHSNARKTGRAGGEYSNNLIKGGLADNINPKYLNKKELNKGINIEREHTKNPELAEEIASDHIIEDPLYYKKLETIEKKPKIIKIKVTKKEVHRAKNQLEKDLSTAIKQTKNPTEKARLEHLYRELRKADNHSKLKNYLKVYGNTLGTLGMAFPFQLVAPIALGGVILGTALTKEIEPVIAVTKLITPTFMLSIGTEATKHSIRTYKEIKKREKQIIEEKTKELKENTTIPTKEIDKIAKRVARQEMSKTKIIHEII